MDFAQALHQLWRRRGWTLLGLGIALVVALSTAYDFSGVPPKLHKKTLALGTGSAALLVDTPKTSVTDLRVDLKPLAARAFVLAHLATSEVVVNRIAHNVGLRPGQLDVEAPIDGAIRPQAARETRIGSILSQNREFRVSFVAQEGLPNIQVNTQAPRVADAVRLANMASATFAGYIHAVQRRQGQPEASRVVLRQLGPAEGGLIAKQINVQLAVLAFLAAFIGWCVLIIMVTGVARNMRAIREAEQMSGGVAADEPAA
jgi:hypothetical protein